MHFTVLGPASSFVCLNGIFWCIRIAIFQIRSIPSPLCLHDGIPHVETVLYGKRSLIVQNQIISPWNAEPSIIEFHLIQRPQRPCCRMSSSRWQGEEWNDPFLGNPARNGFYQTNVAIPVGIFSGDQAALRTLSVYPSVCHTFFTMFLSSYCRKIFRSYSQWQMWCRSRRSRL